MWIAIPFQPHEALQPPTAGYAHVVPHVVPPMGKNRPVGPGDVKYPENFRQPAEPRGREQPSADFSGDLLVMRHRPGQNIHIIITANLI